VCGQADATNDRCSQENAPRSLTQSSSPDTGGNVIGWVPLGDLRSAVQELVAREQAAQQQMPATPQAEAESAPEAKKKN